MGKRKATTARAKKKTSSVKVILGLPFDVSDSKDALQARSLQQAFDSSIGETRAYLKADKPELLLKR